MRHRRQVENTGRRPVIWCLARRRCSSSTCRKRLPMPGSIRRCCLRMPMRVSTTTLHGPTSHPGRVDRRRMVDRPLDLACLLRTAGKRGLPGGRPATFDRRLNTLAWQFSARNSILPTISGATRQTSSPTGCQGEELDPSLTAMLRPSYTALKFSDFMALQLRHPVPAFARIRRNDRPACQTGKRKVPQTSPIRRYPDRRRRLAAQSAIDQAALIGTQRTHARQVNRAILCNVLPISAEPSISGNDDRPSVNAW